MFKKIVLVFAALALAKAQLPNLGWCPDYVPMANFNMDRFLGVWYEAERYFQVSEVISRCVASNYTRGLDGKVRVINEVTNMFTGVKRVLEGEIKPPASKSEEGKLQVKYTTVPFTPETHYSVLETDYDNFAVLWSCSGLGPVHAQNAWLMTRNRIPSTETMQKAYGVLDKYRIWKTYFVKTGQADCYYAPEPTAAPAATPAPAPAPAPGYAHVPTAPVKEPVLPESAAAEKPDEAVHQRSTAILREVEAIAETTKEEAPAQLLDVPAILAEKPAEELPLTDAEPAKEVLLEEKPAVYEIKPEEGQLKAVTPETIPEVILKVAESAKETVSAEEPLLGASPVAEESKTVEVAVPADSKPETIDAALSTPEIAEVAAKPTEDSKVVEAAPIEEPTKLAEELKPVEPVAVEIEKPLEVAEKIESPAPAVLLETVATKSAEGIAPIESAEEIKIVEVAPAAPQLAPVDPTLVKSLEALLPEGIPESAEPAKAPEGGEQLLKKEALAVLETILEPAVPETPVAAPQPLRSVEVAAEESKAEVIDEAPKTLEAKP